MTRIGLFIPCYNCSDQVLRVLKKLDDLPEGVIDQTIVVDNCSKEDHQNKVVNFLMEKSKNNYFYFRNDDNFGLGHSFKNAWKYFLELDFDYMMILHGDDQGNPSDFLEELKRLKNSRKSDTVLLGARFHPRAKLIGYSAIRNIGNIVLNVLASLKFRKKIYDLGSGLNLYPLRVVPIQEIVALPDDIDFDFFILRNLLEKKVAIKFVPITWMSTDEKSTVNQWKVGWDLLCQIVFSPKRNLKGKQTSIEEIPWRRLV